MKKDSKEDFIMEVPRVKITHSDDDTEHYIYITQEITGPEDYVNVFDTLNRAKEGDRINIYLNTPGGRLDTTNQIRGLLLMTKAETTAIVGEVASAGTMLSLCCDNMIVLPGIEFMIHNYSGAAFGKGHEIYQHVEFLKEEMPKLFREYYRTFLTEEEIDDVLKGNDMYLNAEGVIERWQRVLLERDKEIKKMQKDQEQEVCDSYIGFLREKGYVVTKDTAPSEPNEDGPIIVEQPHVTNMDYHFNQIKDK